MTKENAYQEVKKLIEETGGHITTYETIEKSEQYEFDHTVHIIGVEFPGNVSTTMIIHINNCVDVYSLVTSFGWTTSIGYEINENNKIKILRSLFSKIKSSDVLKPTIPTTEQLLLETPICNCDLPARVLSAACNALEKHENATLRDFINLGPNRLRLRHYGNTSEKQFLNFLERHNLLQK